jgi:hypothetical protein
MDWWNNGLLNFWIDGNPKIHLSNDPKPRLASLANAAYIYGAINS